MLEEVYWVVSWARVKDLGVAPRESCRDVIAAELAATLVFVAAIEVLSPGIVESFRALIDTTVGLIVFVAAAGAVVALPGVVEIKGISGILVRQPDGSGEMVDVAQSAQGAGGEGNRCRATDGLGSIGA